MHSFPPCRFDPLVVIVTARDIVMKTVHRRSKTTGTKGTEARINIAETNRNETKALIALPMCVGTATKRDTSRMSVPSPRSMLM